MLIVGSLGLAGFLMYLQMPSALAGIVTIQQVTVSGLEHISRGEVSSLLDLPPDATLFSVDADELERRVEMHPWIADAHIGRLLPHTLTVMVTERQPAALFKHAGGELVLDKEGVVLSIVSGEPYPHLPVVSGLNVMKLLEGHTDQRERIREGIRAAALVNEHYASDLRVVLDRTRYFEVVADSMVFQFSQDVETAWKRFLVLRPSIQAELSGKRDEIDLRYAGKVIVR